MKLFTLTKSLLPFILFFFTSSLEAQVKIGGNPKENPHPSAVLELTSPDKGFLMPRVSQQQMLAIKDPADALVIYNTDAKSILIYSTELQQWMPLLQPTASKLGGDSCEWEFDTLTSRVFLVRGYPLGDSMFYTTDSKKFVFSDRTQNTNSLGQDFPVTSFPGKYYFKATASRFTDSANLNPSLMNVIFEVDSSGLNSFFRGVQIATVNNPKNLQQLDVLTSMGVTTIHAGKDTVSSISGFTNATTLNGTGAANSISGISNSTFIRDSATKNIITMTGIRNSLGNISPLSKVTGNVFGYFGSTLFTDSVGGPTVNGNVYGVFLTNVNGAAPKRNYAFYSSKGHNRFADSTLITDGFFTSPRAVLDVNSTSAMITPAGTTAQRPIVPVAAMLRYNSTGSNMEFYDGAMWKALASGTGEWEFDGSTNRVNLVRGLPLGDSVYYNVTKRKFVFADKRTFGTVVPIDDQFPGKYFFKATASKLFNDETSVSFPSLTMANFLYEVDNDSFAIANPGLAFYNGVRVSTQLLPTATQKPATIRNFNLQLNHTGADSVGSVTAVVSNSFIDGRGATGVFTGYHNNMIVTDSARNNIGTMIGFRNSMTMSDGAGGRITGNAYGYFGTMGGFIDSVGNRLVNGNAYGVFLGNVSIAAPKRNYAFYSNKGHNRFADSTLITDGFFTSPRAVLDVNATSAMIIPSGTTAQRPATGITAMFRNNTSILSPEFFDGTNWQSLSTGPAEWKFDAATNKVNLVRGLALQDTIFYNTQRRQFVFSDRNTNTNSLGSDFPVENFGAKYTFKATASKRDSTQFDGANMNIVYEVDNTTSSTVYNSLSTSAVMNPKAFQKGDQLSGITNTTIHAGNDSVQLVFGIINTARNSGNGRSGSITGIQNAVRIQNGNGNNTGEMVGFRNIMARSGATSGRVTGNVYGWLGSFSGFANNVDGSMYGIFINSVTGAGPRKNYAYYSNKGLNRLGDSLLITDGASITPRAVLDVNSTSAMIVPTGTSAQRPATAVTGMVRYNTENGGRLESFSGTSWSGIISGGIGIDPPNILANSGTTASFAFAGATVGSVVAVSPSSALPNGIVIAWARVSAANTIEIRFENNAAAAVNPPSIGYNIRVIQ